MAIGVLGLALLVAIGTVLTPVAERLRIPPSLVLVVLGFVAFEIEYLTPIVSFEIGGETFNDIVQFILLPTLIFAAAREISTRHFLREIVPILSLAVVSFVVSMLVVGGVLQSLSTELTVLSALLFGALISATDPVAVVATFKRLGVAPRLSTLVQGESVTNDGIAIVMYTIIGVALAQGTNLSASDAFFEFLEVFFGGAAIGIGLGLVASVALSRLDTLSASAFTLAIAYGAYALAELVGFSGVIATLNAGLILGATAATVQAPKLRAALDSQWNALDFVANAVLFILMGIEVDWKLLYDYWEGILVAIGVVYLSRLIGVAPVLTVVCRVFRLPPVGWREQTVLVWGGLRGGVAVALALSIQPGIPGRDLIIALTFGVVLATLSINATTIPFLIRKLGLSEPSRVELSAGEISAVLSVRAARSRMRELDVVDPEVEAHLDTVEAEATESLRNLDLDEREAVRSLQASGLAVARATVQELIDQEQLWGMTGRLMLDNFETEEEALRSEVPDVRGARLVVPLVWLELLFARMQSGSRDDPVVIAYAREHAREVANTEALNVMALMRGTPGVTDGRLIEASARFALMRNYARGQLEMLRSREALRSEVARQSLAWDVTRITADATTDRLASRGIVSDRSAKMAAKRIMQAYNRELADPRKRRKRE